MAIVKRLDKGSELTHAELDGNFTDLDTRVVSLENSGASKLENIGEDTTPELGGDLVTGTNRLKFSSAGGSMLDFTVTQYSVANNTVLSSVGSINMFLDSASADASGDTAFRIFDTTDPDGAVTENTNIFKIADTGDVSVKGNITVDGTNQIQLGAAQDLKIFHNGGHSIIRETGTGSLYLQSDDNVILSTDSSTKKMVKGVGGGEVILYHNDVQKLNTTTSGVTVVDEVHTEGATPHLTLKRTDNANVPTLRFKGQGGTIGASIDFDGTSGDSNTILIQTFDGASLAERLRIGHTGITVAGTLNGHTIPAGSGTLALLSDIGGGGSQNLFSTIASAGQNNIVADGTTDTLYIEAGSGISITTDQNTDTLTITATGGGSSNAISQGNSNVTVTDTGTDGTITFDTEGTDRWSFTSAGHLLPASNADYDIGSADYKVRHLFLSDNSLKFVDSSNVEYTLGVDGGQLQFQGAPIGGGLTNVVDISTGARVDGVLELSEGVNEKLSILTGATGVVDHDCNNGYIFRHTTPAADFTANLTNFYCNNNHVTSVSIMIIQGGTAYIPNALQISGTPQTISWQGGSAPAGNPNKTDVFTFTITNLGASYEVIAQLVDFG